MCVSIQALFKDKVWFYIYVVVDIKFQKLEWTSNRLDNNYSAKKSNDS